MSTDLTSVSTHGWFTEVPVKGYLLPVGTFGWYYDAALSAKLEIINKLLRINRKLEANTSINRRSDISTIINTGIDLDLIINVNSEIESIIATSKRFNLER